MNEDKSVTNRISSEDVFRLMAGFKVQLISEIEETWNSIDHDLMEPNENEVLCGLVTRQARLVTAFAANPLFTPEDLGMIFLRCIAETHINLAWLCCKGEADLFTKFLEHGLGNEKLFLEHYKKNLSDEELSHPDIRNYIDQSEALLGLKKYPHLLEVNLGSWSGMDTRKLAIEANCKSLYDGVFTRGSHMVHGMWNSIALFNMKPCENPLHKLHWIPSFDEPEPNIKSVIVAIKIMWQTLDCWGKHVLDDSYESKSCKDALEKVDVLFTPVSNTND